MSMFMICMYTVHTYIHLCVCETFIKCSLMKILMYFYNLKQVDILISKNQALQILYLKHITLHKLPWIETHENLISTKLNIYTVQFYYYITILNKTYLIIGQQAFSKFFSSSMCVI